MYYRECFDGFGIKFKFYRTCFPFYETLQFNVHEIKKVTLLRFYIGVEVDTKENF